MSDINTVFIYDIRIDEPIVTITDLLVTLVCFIFFFKLHRSNKEYKAVKLFKFYFLTMGVATLFGGLFGHAFLYAAGMTMKLPGWIISMFSIMLIERAAINHTKILLKPQLIKIMQVINLIELALFMFLSIYFLNFFFVEFHSGYGLMFVVLGLEGYLYYKTRNEASKNILYGIALAAVAALIFMNHWSLHQWFNHIAFSHVVMAVAAYFFYRGAARVEMKDAELVV